MMLGSGQIAPVAASLLRHVAALKPLYIELIHYVMLDSICKPHLA